MSDLSELRRGIAEEQIACDYYAECRVIDDDFLEAELPSNDFLEIGVITEGSGIHCVMGQIAPCKSGDIYLVPPYAPHGYFVTESGGSMTVRRLAFCVKDWLRGEVASSDSRRYCYGVFRDGAAVACAMLNSDMRRRVGDILDGINLELKVKGDEWRSVVRAYLVQLLTFVGRYINSSDKLPSKRSDEWETVSAAMEIMKTELGNCRLSLESIAARLYVSPARLSRGFKAQSGQMFSEYLRHLRLGHAADLLYRTDDPVESIAGECGFRDLPSFYRNFRESFGMPPNTYKQFTRSKNKINIEKEELKMQIFEEISTQVQCGKAKLVKELVQNAIDAGASPAEILNQGLLAGMNVIGAKFKNNEVYVPEVLVAARAMNMGTQILKPYLVANGVAANGKVCIGTVLGDLHDIGKNLVKMMMEGKGLEVIDLGTDVSPEAFVNAAIEQNCQVICCSALLTTTMPVMADVVKAAEAAGIRDKVKIMVGGAPVTEEFCRNIGADCYTCDAASAADAAAEFCR